MRGSRKRKPPPIRRGPPETDFSRPQEHHCDLGLIEDDHTPLLSTKPSVSPAKKNTEGNDQNTQKENRS
ncbi:hypothetical protein TPB0596_46380 [Tsukamurella pulmonis]|nr:hypothetical protein TPB0596_46380 [Tsukamurella pulmonis]